jgi:hypothetical protein
MRGWGRRKSEADRRRHGLLVGCLLWLVLLVLTLVVLSIVFGGFQLGTRA